MNKSKRVLLTTSAAPVQSPFSTTEKRPPIGIGFLIAVLKNAGHEVFFIDNYLRASNFLETDYLERNRIDYVGIYANTICYRDTLRMLYKLDYWRRAGRWNGKLIVGGPHATVALNTIPDFVDFVVQGEGERAIVDIVDDRATKRVLSYARLSALDVLPMPAWEYFVHLPYDWGGDWLGAKPVFTMNTSRGCPFGCTFCSVGSIWGRKYTFFSAERIISDIEYLIAHYNAKGIYFREDNFTCNRKRLIKICNLILERDIRIRWACETRVDTLDRDTVKLMQRAGAKAFYLGVESGSQRILDFLNKRTTVKQIRQAFQYCHEFDIQTAASIVIGVPTETEEDLKQTLALIEEVRPTVTWPNVFVGIPDSELYQYTVANKLSEFIDDRGLVYLHGHNDRVKRFYGNRWNATIPVDSACPSISVVMCTYNDGRYLGKAIDSILKQTFQNFELIIVDDKSTDDTQDIIREYADSRLKVIRNSKNVGLTKSLNLGIAGARGEFIARMDADDLSLPHRFETQLRFLESNPDYGLIGSSYYVIDENGSIKSTVTVLRDDRSLREGLKKQNWFGHGSVMMRKRVFDAVGGYNQKFRFAQDYDLWLRIAEHAKVGNIEEPLYCWRSTAECISQERLGDQTYFAEMARLEAKRREETKVEVRSEKPLVSVIVPTYNRPGMLFGNLKSILGQTYQNIEVVVVNDGGAEVENIISFLNERGNLTYIKHGRNRGLAAARNSGIKAARGKYIAYLDDDDIYYPDHIEVLVGFLETHEERVAYADAFRAHQRKETGKYVVTKRDLPYSFDFDQDRILKENFIPVLCLMHEKSCIDEVGYFDEGLRSHEDWDLWIRMSRKYKFAHIKKVTSEFTWREDGSSMTVSKKDEMDRTRRTVLDRGCLYLKEQGGERWQAESVLQRSKLEGGYQEILRRVEGCKGEEAIRELSNFVEGSPNHGEAHNDLGVLYFRLGNSDEALAQIERAVQLDPGRVDFQHNLADVYLEMGRPERAMEVYERILLRYPGDVDTLVRIGSLCCEAGHPSEAVLFYQKAIDIEPTNRVAKESLEALSATRETTAPEASRGNTRLSVSASPPPPDRHEANAFRPRVSIVIPVFNQLRLTHQCLKSIFENTRDVGYEVIVVDNASTDGTTGYLKGIKAACIRLIFQSENRGFVEACRAGAEGASGDYLLFLNNDTEVQPGWLSALVQLAEATPDWGALGAKLVYPDGRLQEAGSIIFSDGNGWNYGRGMDPQDPKFNFVREVDYCSAAALMVRRDLWEEIAGFDLRYAPAYYEDTDLCFEIRKRGYKVYYQPESVVVHHEGKTAGTELHCGYKRYQNINRAKFVEKWSAELKNQHPNDLRYVVRASDRGAKRDILVIDQFLPFYDRASGSLRLLEILKILRQLDYHVTFIARNGTLENRYRLPLERLGIEVHAWDVAAMKASGYEKPSATPINYSHLFQERQFEYALIEFWETAEYYLPLLRRLSPKTQVVIDTVDIHFRREMREAELKKSDELRKKALANRLREVEVYKKADRLWVVTDDDRNAIEGLIGAVPIDVIPNIHSRVNTVKRFEETSDILFVGNFNHTPNRDAARFLCQEIFPLIAIKLPEVKLYVVGNNPADDVSALASDRVVVTGYVEDLSPYLQRSRVSVSPLRYGAGMKGKIGEALSWGLPVVTTPIGAEGMGLIDGRDALIADSADGFAEEVVTVYNDRELWNALSVNGKKKVEAQWSREVAKKRLECVLAQSPSSQEGKLVSIIVLAHNQLEYTRRCLESIFKCTEEPFELVLVDNGSTDGTAQYLDGIRDGNVEVGGRRLSLDEKCNVVECHAEAMEEVGAKGKSQGRKVRRNKKTMQNKESACRRFTVIRNDENRGFAVGNNQGMAVATGDYLLLMNNDVVVTPGWLGRLIACSERRPQIGIVGPMSNYVSGPQLVKDIAYDSNSLAGLEPFAEDYGQKHRGQAKGFWRVVGFCMLIKRAVVRKIGGLDGRYGLGNFEDDDFSLRAALAGFESWIAQDCFVHHFGNRTFIGGGIDYNESLGRNWEIFKKKWGIPFDLPYGASYDLTQVANRGFVPTEHYCPLRPEEVSVSQGEELFRSGHVEEARAVFERIVRADPKYAEALNNLGVIHFQQLELDEAISCFTRALETNHNYFEAVENMGKCMMAQKSYQEAIKWFERAIDLRSEDVNVLNSLANCYMQIEDLRKAEEIYTRSRDLYGKQPKVEQILGELQRLRAVGSERRASP